LLRGDLTEDALIAYINGIRAAIPAGIPVTTADVYGELLSHPRVVAACDSVMANFF
jgi:exo-beta-1,3-glucanase (GH17 family)